jgi:hypothetical protein
MNAVFDVQLLENLPPEPFLTPSWPSSSCITCPTPCSTPPRRASFASSNPGGRVYALDPSVDRLSGKSRPPALPPPDGQIPDRRRTRTRSAPRHPTLRKRRASRSRAAITTSAPLPSPDSCRASPPATASPASPTTSCSACPPSGRWAAISKSPPRGHEKAHHRHPQRPPGGQVCHRRSRHLHPPPPARSRPARGWRLVALELKPWWQQSPRDLLSVRAFPRLSARLERLVRCHLSASPLLNPPTVAAPSPRQDRHRP